MCRWLKFKVLIFTIDDVGLRPVIRNQNISFFIRAESMIE